MEARVCRQVAAASVEEVGDDEREGVDGGQVVALLDQLLQVPQTVLTEVAQAVCVCSRVRVQVRGWGETNTVVVG